VGKTAVLIAVAITVVFACVRAFVYAAHPAFDGAAWVARDLAMTGPRLAACAACLASVVGLGGPRRWGWSWRAPGRGCAFALGAIACVMITILGRRGPVVFGGAQVARILWTTAIVAYWEEVCYRGLAFRGLRETFDPATSAILASALFTVMHVQAQSLSAWPMIFAYGMMSCAAVQEGIGLPWLILAHWVADVVVFAAHLKEEPAPVWTIVGCAFMFAGVMISAARLRTGPRTNVE
jgi:membrane protease YdiL (CAAX protease family)